MNQDNAAHTLLKLPRSGDESLFVEACRILGFEVRGDGVYHADRHVATIQNQRLIVNEAITKELSYDLPPLNLQRQNAINEIYFQLCEERVAIHEAGHAVAAVMQQVDFCYVRIGVEHEVQFCSRNPAPDYRGTPWLAEDRQFVMAAGAAAETLILGDFHTAGVSADRQDLNVCEIMLRDAKGQNPPDSLDVFDERVKEVAAELDAAVIRAVAKHLIERKFLSRAEVEQIVNRIEDS